MMQDGIWLVYNTEYTIKHSVACYDVDIKAQEKPGYVDSVSDRMA